MYTGASMRLSRSLDGIMENEHAMDELLALLAQVDSVDGCNLDDWALDADVNWQDAQSVPVVSGDSVVKPLALISSEQPSKEAREAPSTESPCCFHTGTCPPARRLTRKEEIAALREEADHLTKQLHSLKLAAGLDPWTPVVFNSRAKRFRGLEISAPSLGLWKKVAESQLGHRRASEHENGVLRELVARSRRRAKRLCREQQRRVGDEAWQLSKLLNRPNASIPLSLPDNADVWRRLASRMDETYAKIDSTFKEVEMHKVPRPGRLPITRALDPHTVEFRRVHFVPFDFNRTEAAAWANFAKDPTNNGSEACNCFRFSYPLPVGNWEMLERQVTRRYREEERTVLIHSTVTEPVPGILVENVNQMIVKASEESVSGPTTAIEIYLRGCASITPEIQRKFEKEPPRDDWKLNGPGALQMWEQSIDAVLNSIEESLVGQKSPS